MGVAAVDANTWKWAPILLLSPLPWAVIAVLTSAAGQITINGAETACVDPSGGTVDTSMMSTGANMAVVAAYLFLATFTWTWLGHSVHVTMPSKHEGAWHWKSVCVARPFRKLSTIVYLYGTTGVVSLAAACLQTAGVAYAATLCHSQTPMLVSFSTMCFIVFWVAMGVTLSRLFTMLYGKHVKALAAKAGVDVDGSPSPQSDIDMVKVIFKQFDHEGDGHMESSELGAFLELLGMDPAPDKLEEILVSRSAAAKQQRGGKGGVGWLLGRSPPSPGFDAACSMLLVLALFGGSLVFGWRHVNDDSSTPLPHPPPHSLFAVLVTL